VRQNEVVYWRGELGDYAQDLVLGEEALTRRGGGQGGKTGIGGSARSAQARRSLRFRYAHSARLQANG